MRLSVFISFVPTLLLLACGASEDTETPSAGGAGTASGGSESVAGTAGGVTSGSGGAAGGSISGTSGVDAGSGGASAGQGGLTGGEGGATAGDGGMDGGNAGAASGEGGAAGGTGGATGGVGGANAGAAGSSTDSAGAGGDGGLVETSCGEVSCDDAEVCIATRVVGGGVDFSDDNGDCPPGKHIEPQVTYCVADFTYQCQELSGCSTSDVRCDCGAGTCPSNAPACTDPQPDAPFLDPSAQLICELQAP